MSTIVFFPEGAFGPTNNCVGIGQVLQARGHRVVFIVEESVADRSPWPAFLEEVERTHRTMWADFDAFCRARGAPGLTWGAEGPDFIHESPWLNLYLYPAEADYARERQLSPTWHRLDSSVRA